MDRCRIVFECEITIAARRPRNIKNKKCIYSDCKTSPSFNYKSEIKAIYCAKHKLKDMVNIIASEFNFKGKIVWDLDKPEGQFRKPSDNSIIRSIAPDFRFTPIEEGIHKSITWFKDNYPNIRK